MNINKVIAENLDKFIEINFSKLTDNNKVFMRNDFVCIHYDHCKISPQIIEWKFFGVHMNFLQLSTLWLYQRISAGV